MLFTIRSVSSSNQFLMPRLFYPNMFRFRTFKSWHHLFTRPDSLDEIFVASILVPHSNSTLISLSVRITYINVMSDAIIVNLNQLVSTTHSYDSFSLGNTQTCWRYVIFARSINPDFIDYYRYNLAIGIRKPIQ